MMAGTVTRSRTFRRPRARQRPAAVPCETPAEPVRMVRQRTPRQELDHVGAELIDCLWIAARSLSHGDGRGVEPMVRHLEPLARRWVNLAAQFERNGLSSLRTLTDGRSVLVGRQYGASKYDPRRIGRGRTNGHAGA